MSVYGYINCHDCKQSLWLGKALHEGYKPFAFHAGDDKAPKNWNKSPLSVVLWKFLADHTAHNIGVCLEHEMTNEMYEYQEIGGDSNKDISFGEYLSSNEFYVEK